MKAKTKLIIGIVAAILVAVIGITTTLVVTGTLEKKQQFIVRNEENLNTAIKRDTGDKQIVFAEDVSTSGDITMSYLNSIDLNGHTLTVNGDLVISSTQAKDMSIYSSAASNGLIKAESITIEAPSAHVEWSANIAGTTAMTVHVSPSTFVFRGEFLTEANERVPGAEITLQGGAARIESAAPSVDYKIIIPSTATDSSFKVISGVPETSTVQIVTGKNVEVGGAVSVSTEESIHNIEVKADENSVLQVSGSFAKVEASGSDVTIAQDTTVTEVTAKSVDNSGTISGSIAATGDVTNKGTVSGSIETQGNVTNSGTVEGDVRGEVVTQEGGSIKGDVLLNTKTDQTITITVNDFEYGKGMLMPEVSGNLSGEPEYTYKKVGEPDSEYSTAIPTDAGEYVVRAYLAGDAIYNPAKTTATYTITKQNVARPLTGQTTFIYDGRLKTYEPTISSLYSNDSTNLTATNAGEYRVTYTLNDPANYQWAAISGGAAATSDPLVDTWIIARADIEPLDLTVSINGWTYGGEAQSPSTSGFPDGVTEGNITYIYYENGSTTALSGKPTNAGTYQVEAVIAVTTNYNSCTSDKATFTIARANNPTSMTITGWAAGTGVTPNAPEYTNKPAECTDITIEYTPQSEENFTTTPPTTVGEYTVRVTIRQSENYEGVVLTANFSVGKEVVAVPVADPATYTYTGNAITYKIAPSDKYDITGNLTQTDAGTYQITISLVDPATTAWSTGGTDDIVYEFVINRAEVTAPTLGAIDYTYDATEKSITEANFTTFETDKYTLDGDKTGTNAATYTATLTLNSNYKWSDGTDNVEDKGYTWEIKKADFSRLNVILIGEVIGEIPNRIRFGEAVSPTIDGLDNETIAALVGYTYYAGTTDLSTPLTEKPTAVSSYTVTAVLVSTDNYDGFALIQQSFEIIASTNSWTTEFSIPASFTYGTMPTIVEPVADKGTATIAYYVAGTSENPIELSETTPAGDYYALVTVAEAADGSYSGLSDEYPFTITKAQVAAPVRNSSATYTYTGSEQTFAWTTAPDANLCKVTGDKQTNAGNYTATVSLTNSNYTWVGGSSDDIVYDWSIAKATVAAPVPDSSATYTYTGREQTFAWTTAPDTILCTVTGDKQTTASTAYSVSVALKYPANYKWADLTGITESSDRSYNWTIAKATLTGLSITGLNNVVYDETIDVGVARLPEDFPSVTLTVKYSQNGIEQTVMNAGTYRVEVTIPDTDNYNGITLSNDNFTIAKATVAKPTPKTKTYTYTGSQQTFEWDGTLSNLYTVTGDKQTTASTAYSVSVALNDTANFKWAGLTGDNESDAQTYNWTIAKATHTGITAAIQGWTVRLHSTTNNAPRISANPETGSVSYTYYNANGAITSITDIANWNIGSYEVTATIAETANYEAYTTARVGFNITSNKDDVQTTAELIDVLSGIENHTTTITVNEAFSINAQKFVDLEKSLTFKLNAALTLTATEGEEGEETEIEVLTLSSGYFVFAYEETALKTAAADEDKDTYIMLANDLAADVVVYGTKTLDTLGYTLTNATSHTITNNGTLTILGDGKIDNITHSKAALVNNVGATAIIGELDSSSAVQFTRSEEAGTYEPYGANGNSYYYIQNFGTMTINNAKVETTVTSGTNQTIGGFSSLIANGWQNTKNVSGIANLTINGGTFNGGINSIKNDEGGVLNITGGSFTNSFQYAVQNWNVATISGGTFKAELTESIMNGVCVATSAGKLTITGGTFESAAGKTDIAWRFDSTDTDVIAQSTITGSQSITVYATNGTSLLGAVARNLGTIKLAKDATVSATDFNTNLNGKSLTIDLNGKNLTVTSSDVTEADTSGTTNKGVSVKVNTNQTLTICDSSVTIGENEKVTSEISGAGTLNLQNTAYARAALNANGGTIKLEKINLISWGSIGLPQNSGQIIVESSYVTTDSPYGIATNATYDGDIKIVINNSTIDVSNYGQSTALMINNSLSLTVDNSNIIGGIQAVAVRAGQAKITNSSLTATSSYSTTARINPENWGSGNTLGNAALVVGSSAKQAHVYLSRAVVELDKVLITGSNIADTFAVFVSHNATLGDAARLAQVTATNVTLVQGSWYETVISTADIDAFYARSADITDHASNTTFAYTYKITGGTYTQEPVVNTVASGYTVLEYNGTWTVCGYSTTRVATVYSEQGLLAALVNSTVNIAQLGRNIEVSATDINAALGISTTKETKIYVSNKTLTITGETAVDVYGSMRIYGNNADLTKTGRVQLLNTTENDSSAFNLKEGSSLKLENINVDIETGGVAAGDGTITYTNISIVVANESELKAAVENTAVSKIILGSDITLAAQLTIDHSLTLDFNGYTISGENKASSGAGSGVVVVSASNVVFEDKSTSTKGGITNTSTTTGAALTVRTLEGGAAADLTIKDGVRIVKQGVENPDKAASNAFALFAFRGSRRGIVNITIEDAYIYSNGVAIRTASIKGDTESEIIVEGGTFEAVGFVFSNSSAPMIERVEGGTFRSTAGSYISGLNASSTITGGTFYNLKAGTYLTYVPSGKVVVVKEVDEKNFTAEIVDSSTAITDAALASTTYTYTITGTETKVDKNIYLMSGDLKNIMTSSAGTYNIHKEDVVVNLSGYGGTTGGNFSRVLTFNMDSGATLGGSISLKVAKIVVEGEGFSATVSANEALYGIIGDETEEGKKYTCDLIDESAVIFKIYNAETEITTLYTSAVNLANIGTYMSSAGNGGTVTLMQDLDIGNNRIAITESITLDLNGHKITSTSSNATIYVEASNIEFTIKNSSETQATIANDLADEDGNALDSNALAVNLSNYGVVINVGANILLEKSIFMQGNSTRGANTLNFAGEVINEIGYGIATNGSSVSNVVININDNAYVKGVVGIYLPSGTLNVKGGTIEGENGIYVKNSTVNISGGKIIGTGDKANYTYNGSGCNATGDALVIESSSDAYNDGKAPVVTITGGTFTSTNNHAVAAYAYTGKTPITGFITAGKFISTNEKAIGIYESTGNALEVTTAVVEGSIATTDDDGKTYTVSVSGASEN